MAVPVAAGGPEQALQQAEAARAAGADIIELRADYLEGLSVDLVAKLVAEIRNAGNKRLPVIVTCRDRRQGGMYDYPPRLRVDVLVAALKAGAEFIDCEYDNFIVLEN
ncbi:MAG: type I 3-dehydroquinate dehydratase, partial [Planctomycetota bacterium]